MTKIRLLLCSILILAAATPRPAHAQAGDPFADRVVDFTPGDPPSGQFGDPGAALGPPDFNQAILAGWVTLGVGGRITLEFVDNVVVNGPGPDLKLHGDPANDEQVELELSADGKDYMSLGLLGESAQIDLGEIGFEQVRFVRVRDDGSPAGGISPGAEVDAVEALNSGPVGGTAPSITTTIPPAAPLPAAPVWVRTGGPLGGLGYDVRIRPDNSSLMYVTDAFAGVHISQDAGLTWTPSNEGIATRGGESGDAIPVFSLTLDPNDPDILWAGTQFQRGIFKSTDGGRTWTKSESGVVERDGITFRGFAVEPRNSSVVYAAAEVSSWAWAGAPRQGREFDLTQGVVYKTTNGGGSWKPVWRGDNLARYVWIDPRDVNVVYISTGIFDREAANSDPDHGIPGGEGVLKSTDGGQTWTNMNTGLDNLYVGSLFMHPGNPDILVAGTGNNQYFQNAGVYLTTDGGRSWVSTLNGPIITSVEFAASDPDIAYAGGPENVYRSTDGGRTWERMTSDSSGQGWGPPGVRAGFPIDFQLDPRERDRLFSNQYGGGNLLSLDGGQTWQVASTGYTGAQVRALAADPGQPGRLIAAARSGIFETYDGGTEWIGLSNGSSRVMGWNAVALDPSNPRVLLASNNWQSKLLRSLDGGLTWTPTSADISDVRAGWRVIVFAPSDPRIAYAGSAGYYSSGVFDLRQPGVGIWRSDNGGAQWTDMNSELTRAAHVAGLAVAHDDPMWVMAAAAGQGLLLSTDGGATWQQMNAGIGGLRALSVAVHPRDRGTVLAGFDRGGLYRSTDGGRTWSPSAAGMAPEASVTSIVFDLANSQRIYAATSNTGVFHSEDGGQTWRAITDGLRTRSVNALALSSDNLHLYAATEGEGVFRLDLNAQPPPQASGPRPAAATSAAPATQLATSADQPKDRGVGGLLPCGSAAILPLALLGMQLNRARRRIRRM